MPNRLLIAGKFAVLLMLAGGVSLSAHGADAGRSLQSGELAKTRVSAVDSEWRNSGIQVQEGGSYRIAAEGKWRTYGTCNYTGPDGAGLYTLLCPKNPLFPPLLAGYSHSTLIARIGEDGEPFAVGGDYEFRAGASGTLFFHVNDKGKWTGDNDGFVDVEIQVLDAPPVVIPTQLAEVEPMRPPAVEEAGDAAVPPAQPVAMPVAAEQAEAAPTLSQDKQMLLDVALATERPRTALVIGNSDYSFSPLKNPANDAKAMAASLERLGFTVILKLDANQQQMESAIDEFAHRVTGGNHVALFYYAGHGVQVDGENYLIPTGVSLKRQSDVRYKAVNVGQVLGAMGEAKDNLNIVIMDACRDNPLPRSFRSASRGLARVEGPKGTIIGFATSPGSVASDGDGDNGVYTKHLLANMNKPGLSVEQVFKEVLKGVNAETGGKQVPWTESSFTGEFSFAPR